MFPNIPIFTSNIVKRQLIRGKIQLFILTEENNKVNNLKIRVIPTSYPYYQTTCSLLIEDDEIVFFMKVIGLISNTY